MLEAIELIKRYYDIGDKVTIEDIATMYHELTWRDLYEDNKHNLLDENIATLTLFNDIKIDIHLEPVDADYFIIKDISPH